MLNVQAFVEICLKKNQINYTDGKKINEYASSIHDILCKSTFVRFSNRRKFQSKSYQLFFHFLIPCLSFIDSSTLRQITKILFTKRSDSRRGNTAATNILQTIQIPLISRKLLYLSSGLNKLHYIWHHMWRVFGCSIKWRLERGRGAYNKSHNQSEL